MQAQTSRVVVGPAERRRLQQQNPGLGFRIRTHGDLPPSATFSPFFFIHPQLIYQFYRRKVQEDVDKSSASFLRTQATTTCHHPFSCQGGEGGGYV